MKTLLCLPSLALAACSLSTPPVAAPARPALPSALALSCSGCHATAMAAEGLPTPLHGISESALRTALLEFRSGARQGVIMPRLCREFSDAEIAELAAYFAGLDPP